MEKSKGNKNIIAIIAVIGIIAAVVLTYFFKQKSESHGDKAPIKIGAVLPLSGSLGFMGQMEGDGMKLAVEDINSNGGINGAPLEIVFEDSQGKPDIAVTATQRIMNIEGIKIITSSFSSVTLALMPVVKKNGGILIGACMHPDFFKDSSSIFRFYIGVEDESKGFVDYLTSQKKIDFTPKIGVLYVEAPNVVEQLEKYVEPGLKQAGLELAVKEPYKLDDKEFRNKILKFRSADITHLLIIGYGFLYPNIFNELKEQQLLDKVQIVGGWGFLYPNVKDSDLEGVVVVGPSYVFEKNKEIDSFYKRFESKFGYKANFDAAMTYASIQLIAAAIQRSNNPNNFTKSLDSLGKVDTLIGKTKVDEYGATHFDIGIGHYRKGVIVDN